MKSRILQWLGIFLIFELGLLHFLGAQIEFLKSPILGYLTMLFFLGGLIATFGIYHRQVWGWTVGFLVAAASIFVFVWRRTLGLPGQIVEPWLYPYGLVGAVAAGLFIMLVLPQPWKGSGPSILPVWIRYLLPSLAVLGVMAVSLSTYQWDTYARVIGYHRHVGSVRAVCSTPLTTFAEMEERYGIKVSQMNISMMDSIVDVRLIILDPVKAQSLLRNQGALLVDQEVLVLAPHQHSHWLMRKDKAHIMFFPTLNDTIRSGSEVSLVFGSVRVEPIVIR